VFEERSKMNISNRNTYIPKDPLFKTLSKASKPVASFIALQEASGSLSNVRFIQDTVTNWVPKATFSRSKADLAESSILEFTESFLVYYMPAILGEKIFRKIFSKNLLENEKKLVSTPARELLNNKSLNSQSMKKLNSVKAAIALAGLCIPLTQFCLNYVTNLFTLKVFKKANFENIMNLNKKYKETKEEQDKVKNSAVKNIKRAAIAGVASVGLAALLAFKGHKSKSLQSLSEYILMPGKKLFKNNEKMAKWVDNYFSIEFANNKGKLSLSKGQITSCVFIAGLGYLGAAKDRGKQNFLEVLSRYPLVGFYVITGGSMLDKYFKKYLSKKDGYKDLIDKDLNVPRLDELPELANKLSVKNNSSVENEFKKLFKEKSIITGVPFLFGLMFMGFFVAGITRFWTAYRCKKEHEQNECVPSIIGQKIKDNSNL